MADSNYCVVVERGTRNILVAKKRESARYPNFGYNITHNPGQYVFPGGDQHALIEFRQETGVRLKKSDYGVGHTKTFEEGNDSYEAFFVFLDRDVFNDVLTTVKENLALGGRAGRDKAELVQHDELDSIHCMSIDEAIEFFAENRENADLNMNTSWFYNICIYLKQYLEESDY